MLVKIEESVVAASIDPSGNVFDIKIKGVDPSKAFNYLKLAMSHLLHDLEVPKESVLLSYKCPCIACSQSKKPEYFNQDDIEKRQSLGYKTVVCRQSLLDVDLDQM